MIHPQFGFDFLFKCTGVEPTVSVIVRVTHTREPLPPPCFLPTRAFVPLTQCAWPPSVGVPAASPILYPLCRTVQPSSTYLHPPCRAGPVEGWPLLGSGRLASAARSWRSADAELTDGRRSPRRRCRRCLATLTELPQPFGGHREKLAIWRGLGEAWGWLDPCCDQWGGTGHWSSISRVGLSSGAGLSSETGLNTRGRAEQWGRMADWLSSRGGGGLSSGAFMGLG